MKQSICLGLLAAAVAGCGGDPRAPVKGVVTVAGKGPLPGGSIQFVSAADPARTGSGQIKHDGTYEVPDAPVGECKVLVENTFLGPASGRSNPMATPGGPPAGVKMAAGMGGPPPGVGPAGKSASPDAAKKMSALPKGVEIPAEMGDGRGETTQRKYVKIDTAYSKADATPLKALVEKNGGTHDFEVK